MFAIRKFVGYAGAAAGLAVSSQTGIAAAPARAVVVDRQLIATPAPSAACTSAIQAIKDAVVSDRSEDATERAVAKTNPDLATDKTEDGAERAAFVNLFTNARTACAPTVAPPPESKFTPSAQCLAAIQALKAAWTQSKPATPAQWRQLMSLAAAVRSACGPVHTWEVR